MERPEFAWRSSSGLWAGIVAGVGATAGMLAVGQVFGQPTIAETLAEAIAGITPVQIIEGMIGLLGTGAKKALFVTVLAGQVILGGGLGALATRRGLSALEIAASVAVALAAIAMVLLPVMGAGVLGASARAGAGATLSNLAVTGALFCFALWGMIRYLNPRGVLGAEEAASRRAFLRTTLLATGAVIVGVGIFRWLAERLSPPEVGPAQSVEAARTTTAAGGAPSLAQALAEGVPGLSPEITPNDKFYVVSKNVFRDPDVNGQAWRLEVGGAVERPLNLNYDQIRALPSVTQYFTLICISNEVGGNLTGNALWRGVPLRTLLDQAGVLPGAVDVVLRAADDYSDSIPIEKAMEPGTVLAYEMNGEVLPKNHGFPARLLVPDIYGMKNVKWVTKIEVVQYDFKGFWMVRGWSDVATINTTSRIDAPKNASRLVPGPNYIGGIALAGARGIKTVEVSTDGGRTWAPAVVKAALGPYTWVLWLYEWPMPASEEGTFRLLVRATDGTGAVQSATAREALPDGATGLHAVVIRTAG